MGFDSVDSLLADIRAGTMVIVTDDVSRENEGDLIMAAEKVTPEHVNFMAKYGRGLICVPMKSEKLDRLGLTPMVERGSDDFNTAFSVSVDAKRGITTGISASDRATTIRLLASPECTPDDIVTPGHVFPLRAKDGGVLIRAGHTEATHDLVTMAGLYPAGVICEIMNDDGTMARIPDLVRFKKQHRLRMCSIAQIIEYRRRKEKLVAKVSTAKLPTRYGVFDLMLYETTIDKECHLALILGDIHVQEPVFVRVHSECLTGDVFRSLRCDCGAQLDIALRIIAEEGRGVVLYMRQEGRGIGLAHKIKAYSLQDGGLDTVEANEKLGFKPDLREYGIGAQILADLGLKKIRLLTNNPRKIIGLDGYGLEVVERKPLKTRVNLFNKTYLDTKKKKLGHLL